MSDGGDDVLTPEESGGHSGCFDEVLLYFPLYTLLGFMLATFYAILMLPKNPSDTPLFISVIHMIIIVSLLGLYFTRHIYVWLFKKISKLPLY